MHFERHTIDKHDQEKPRIWRGVIYMCEPNTKDGVAEPSVARQRDLCRREATRLRVEVVGEFVDIREFRYVRPGLYHALQLARERQLDYLIVTSLDVLADFGDDRFEVAWHLGQAGTIPIEAMTEDD
jgi:Resolvase, N terminal domain